VIGVISWANVVHAEVITIEGTIRSIDATTRTVTVDADGEEKTLDVSRKVKVSVGGNAAALDALRSGQKVKLSYHDDLEIVLKIEAAPGGQAPVTFELQGHKCDIRIDNEPFASYVFRDEGILRPYFANVYTRHGIPVTRRYPAPPNDNDHARGQPGLSLAFGDLNGIDFFSGAGRVRHVEFVEEPTAKDNSATFAVKNSYEAGRRTICEEKCQITLHVQPEGTLLVWDSVFQSKKRDFYFGDMKEMGLGLRVATSLKVQSGGTMIDSEGRVNQRGIWGKQADWCQCSRAVDGQQAGVVLIPDPSNFRRSWFHVRDYGFMVANPFGQSVFTDRRRNDVEVRKNERFRLRFGVFIWDSELGEAPDIDAVYRSLLRQMNKS